MATKTCDHVPLVACAGMAVECIHAPVVGMLSGRVLATFSRKRVEFTQMDYVAWFKRSMRSAVVSGDHTRLKQLWALVYELPYGTYVAVVDALIKDT